jgi:hypothetical protein
VTSSNRSYWMAVQITVRSGRLFPGWVPLYFQFG